MGKPRLTARTIAIASGLSAVSAVTQLAHIGYQSPQFGMWIDIVAVSWLIAFFMFGPRMVLIVSGMGALVITLFAPETWLGASMKLIASTPMWLIPAIWISLIHKNVNYYKSINLLIIPLIIGILVRCIVVIPINYYFAIPIWTGMTTTQAISTIPWYIIALFNLIQGLVDVVVAWIVVYRFKLNQYSYYHHPL